MIVDLLANTAPPDPLISGNWIIALIGAIAAGIALVVGKKQGRADAETRDINVKKPVPTIPFREEPQWATKPELDEHIARFDKMISEIWTAIQSERGVARESLGKIHQRLDAQSNATATLQGTVEEVKENVSKLLDLALHRNPTH